MQHAHHSEEEIRFAERLKRLSGERYEKALLGFLIRGMREKSKMTQKALASKLQTTQSVVARMEQGKQNFTVKTLVKIAAIFNKKLHVGFR